MLGKQIKKITLERVGREGTFVSRIVLEEINQVSEETVLELADKISNSGILLADLGEMEVADSLGYMKRRKK